MESVLLIARYLIFAVVSGLIGTGVMTLFMTGLTKSGATNARMVYAVGALLTRSGDRAVLVGSIVHLLSGVTFGLIYTLILMGVAAAGSPGLGHMVFTGLLVGLVHGVMVSFFLVASVADQHPLDEFKEAGMAVALAHAAGHVLYGLTIGVLINFSGLTAF